MEAMPTSEIAVRMASGAGLLLANGYFVTTEFAMTRLRQFDEEEFQENRGLQRAWEMTEELEIYLTGCQVGITVCSILLGVVFEPAISALIGPLVEGLGIHLPTLSVILSVGIIQLLHTVWGEQAPTYLGVERPKGVASFCAIPLYWWTTMAYPFIYIGDKISKATLGLFGVTIERSWAEGPDEVSSRGELRREMGELLSLGRVPEERRQEVINALQIGSIPTHTIMVPRDEIIALSTEYTPEKNVRILEEAQQARFPLIGGSIDELFGFVYSPALFGDFDDLRSGKKSYKEVATPPMTVPSDLPISDLVDAFQAENQEIALVEEEGEVVGLVTATDAFEAIIGDLEDPFD